MSELAFALPGRSQATELMDDPSVDYETFAGCLRDLERVNVASLGYRPTLSWLSRIVGTRTHLSILDVGAGHADMLRAIARWASQRRISVTLTAVDLNPWSAKAAHEATPDDIAITYLTTDVFELPEPPHYDVIISALFTHHLGDADLVRFVRWMQDTARLGWFVNDLHRHPIAYRGLQLLFALWPIHPFVRHDGPVSVQRAFSRDDWNAVLRAAAVPADAVEVRWRFPFRWGVGTRP